MKKLEKLFNPESIAVVGVSEDPTKLGSVLYFNIKDSGFKGKLHAVNPKHKILYGEKTYKNISSIQGKVDLVCIAIPAPFVKDVIKDAAKKHVKTAIIITAGFREIGKQGEALEKELKQVAKEAGIKLLGPNCLGMINPGMKLNASFAASTPQDGNIAFLSQSGAFCTAMLDMSLEKQVGFSHFVSLGNKADINENELIEYWLNDPKVKVIGAYLEEINRGQDLIKLTNSSKTPKPLVIFKPGETEEAKKAISSHTGSLAGSSATFKTAARQNGMIEVNEVNEMFNTMMGFSWANPPEGKRVAVITNAGGPGIIATDEIIRHGLEMADITRESKEQIKKYLPATASVNNPIDVIGDALAERYRAPIDILANDKNVDAILVILTPQLVTQIEETAKLIINSSKKTNKPIFTVFLGGKYVVNGLARLYDNQIPSFRYISDAVRVLSAMHDYNLYSKKSSPQIMQVRNGKLSRAGKGKYRRELIKEIKTGKENPSENLATKIAEEVGLDLPRQIITLEIKEIKDFAKGKYPIVLKATTELIAHKSDVKALFLNIKNEKQLEASFTELITNIKKVSNTQKPEILVQEQIVAQEELLIGATRDGESNVYEPGEKGFGHLLVVGKGGIYTEVYKDISQILLPSTPAQMKEELEKTKVYEILKGTRGQSRLAISNVIEAMEAVEKMVLLYPEIASLDINPLMVTKTRAVAVDIKIFLK